MSEEQKIGKREGKRNKEGKTTHPGFPSLSSVNGHPVIDAVFHLAAVLEHFREELSKEIIVGALLESKFPNVVEVDRELLCDKISGEEWERPSSRQVRRISQYV